MLAAKAERRALVLNPLSPSDPAIAEYFGGGPASASGEVVSASTAMQEETVLACVRYLSENTVASLPGGVFRRLDPGRERADGHWLDARLRDQPNAYMTPFDFWNLLMNWVLLRGNWYFLLRPSARMEPFELWPLHPDRITHVELDNGERFYDYQPPKGGKKRFSYGEVAHLGFMPDDGWKGKSVIAYARDAIGRSLAASKYQARTWRNNAAPGGILKVKRRLSPQAKKTLREDFEALHQGQANAGRFAVFEEDMDWQPVSMSNEDAQTLQLMQANVITITRIFNVKPHKVNALERATWANIEHQEIENTTDTVRPWVVRTEQALNKDCLTREDRAQKLYTHFNLDGLLRGDFKTRQEGQAIQRQWGIISGNQWAQNEDMNPFEGGDIRLVPLNMVPLTENMTGGVDDAEAEGAPAGDPSAEVQQLALNGAQIASLLEIIQQVSAKQLSPVTAKEMLKISFPTLTQQQIDRLVDSADAFVPALQAAAQPAATRSALATVRETRTLEIVRRVRTSHEPIIQDAAWRLLRREADTVERQFRRSAQERALSDFVTWTTSFYGDQRAAVVQAMTPSLSALSLTVSEMARDLVGVGVGQAEGLDAFLSAYVAALAARHVGESRGALLGLATDEDPEATLARAEALFGGWRSDRPARIAAAESVRLSNATTRFVWQAMGVEKVSWWRSGDCADCGVLAGKIISIRDEFAPGVSHGPLHDGCQCSLAPVVGG